MVKNSKNKNIIHDTVEIYNKILNDPITKKYVKDLSKILKNYKLKKRKVIIAGNGGSASIASHVSVDMTKVVGIKCLNFNEPNLITCFTNDFGQDLWLKKSLEFYSDRDDLVILISSSGRSKNIINAAKFCIKQGNKIVVMTGFNKNNPLNKLVKDPIWINSKAYNIIENFHQIILLMSCDVVLGSIYYNSN
ncbi:MAG: hypothetical protein CBB97_18105 [Candidatus Endolissoclinum sp. TMED37]|nr:MAG: hypothetical protein CBB97_18105 [Candidatus Endolissoclinum sp. TMED37]|tara:strand:- start:165 stop:740 length:576 start_codon:yes stop_codon:yes gene_type:complete